MLKQDTLVLVVGLVAILLFDVAIWLGAHLHWGSNAVKFVEDPSRFSIDTGGDWYYWQGPQEFGGIFTSWLGYILHQGTIWALLYKAQSQQPKYSSKLQRFNWELLGANAFFHVLHFVQTHVFYSALANTVTVWSSQASVIVILVFSLIIQNERRGLFFGYKIPLPKSAVALINKYHAYLFSWGAIYTFWYHPMENLFGHLLGFTHTAMMMLQGSLIYTPIHKNPYWSTLVEVFVIIHGPVISVQKNDGAAFMFIFGFLLILVISQIFCIPLFPHEKKWIWLRFVPLILALASAVAVYATAGIARNLFNIVFIPIAEYGLAFLFIGMVWFFFRIFNGSCCPALQINYEGTCCSPTPEEGVKPFELLEFSELKKKVFTVFGVVGFLAVMIMSMIVAMLLQVFAFEKSLFLLIFTFIPVGISSTLSFVFAGYALQFRNLAPKAKNQKEEELSQIK